MQVLNSAYKLLSTYILSLQKAKIFISIETMEENGLMAAFSKAMSEPQTAQISNNIDTDNIPDNSIQNSTENDIEVPGEIDVQTLPQKNDFNLSEYLKTTSEGLIDSEETFKSYIPKIKDYNNLETKLREIESKIPQFKNDETKALYELWANGDKDVVVNYIKESTKDYKTMSDIDIVRESLSKSNPNWTSKDIELELRAEYGKQLEKIDVDSINRYEEPDAYEKAITHNEKVEENLLKLQRDARDRRLSLIEQQNKIELPQINKSETPLVTSTPNNEVEIQERTEQWIKDVDDKLIEFKSIKQNIDGKEVEYVFTNDEVYEMKNQMKNFNIFDFAKERGWYNDDMSTNVLKLAEDVQKLTKFDKLNKSFSTQIRTDATKDTIKKIKNIDPSNRGVSDATPQSFNEAFESAYYG